MQLASYKGSTASYLKIIISYSYVATGVAIDFKVAILYNIFHLLASSLLKMLLMKFTE